MTAAELSLTPPAAPLLAGVGTRCTLRVVNPGSEVEHYTVQPTGTLAAWTVLEQTELRLWPGRGADVEVRVVFPCAPVPRAGPATVGVVVRNGDGSSATAEQPAAVAPCAILRLDRPEPHALWTAHHALVHVTVGNEGNVALPVRLVVGDREGRLAWFSHPDGDGFQLGPGDRVARPVRLSFRDLSWLGKDAAREYVARVTAPSQPGAPPLEQTTSGVLTQLPVVRRWWLAVFFLLMSAAFVAQGGWGNVFGFPGLAVGAAILVAAIVRLLRTVHVARPPLRPPPPPPRG